MTEQQTPKGKGLLARLLTFPNIFSAVIVIGALVWAKSEGLW